MTDCSTTRTSCGTLRMTRPGWVGIHFCFGCVPFCLLPMSSPCACPQIETGSGDKQSNVSLVSREDFERLKNLTQSSSSITQTQSSVPEDDIEVCFQHNYIKRLRISCVELQWSKRLNNFIFSEENCCLIRDCGVRGGCGGSDPGDDSQQEKSERLGVSAREGGRQVLPSHQGAGPARGQGERQAQEEDESQRQPAGGEPRGLDHGQEGRQGEARERHRESRRVSRVQRRRSREQRRHNSTGILD